MSRSLFAVLTAALLLTTPVSSGQAHTGWPTSLVDGCWPGATWDELGIKNELAIKAG